MKFPDFPWVCLELFLTNVTTTFLGIFVGSARTSSHFHQRFDYKFSFLEQQINNKIQRKWTEITHHTSRLKQRYINSLAFWWYTTSFFQWPPTIFNTCPSSPQCPVWCQCRLVVRVGLNQRSYSTLDPVNARMGDRFRTGKPPGHRTMHSGLLSLSHPSVSRQKWVLAVALASAREETASPA